MTDLKHSELPWRVQSSEAIRIKDNRNDQLAILTHISLTGRRDGDEVMANAEFIVRACNSHYELVHIAEQYHGYLVTLMATNSELFTQGGKEYMAHAWAILNKAKGETQ